MRRIKQESYFPAIIFGHFLLWLVDLLRYSGDHPLGSLNIAGEVFSSWAVTVIAINFLMATKARWVERLFGGLDKMYMIHRRSGIIATALLIIHFIIIPRDPVFIIGKPLGFFALVLLLVGIVLSAAPFVKRIFPYGRWRMTHKLMGVAYILGVAHVYNVSTLTSELPLVRSYVSAMMFIGVAAWIYKVFLYGLFNRKIPYEVTRIEHFEDDTSKLILQPQGEKRLDFNVGQFAFFSIPDLGTKEAHPFTLSSHPVDSDLCVTVKSLGDYTADLQQNLKVGASVQVEGPFGLFDYQTARFKKQIWLAGGIGITPFLPFLQNLEPEHEVTLVWAVRSSKSTFYREKIESLAKKNPGLEFILNISDQQGRFTIDQRFSSSNLKGRSVMICGPEAMREGYIKQLLEKGVSFRDIHFEEFSFR
ncbi:MAG: ferric reductase-like transmembrane domain-containing protein [Candidatus Krumholzibacteria bacterium]|nr:ferric reductase-like transmembrane domain-containing protein [Candidatus Krumholzibacteria bacterium]